MHQVKIDKAFVTHLPDDPVDQAVVEAVSRIAHAASLEVVAEGVETHAQAMKLLRLGIRHHQGFLYSQAVPADRMTEILGSASGSSSSKVPKLAGLASG